MVGNPKFTTVLSVATAPLIGPASAFSFSMSKKKHYSPPPNLTIVLACVIVWVLSAASRNYNMFQFFPNMKAAALLQFISLQFAFKHFCKL